MSLSILDKLGWSKLDRTRSALFYFVSLLSKIDKWVTRYGGQLKSKHCQLYLNFNYFAIFKNFPNFCRKYPDELSRTRPHKVTRHFVRKWPSEWTQNHFRQVCSLIRDWRQQIVMQTKLKLSATKMMSCMLKYHRVCIVCNEIQIEIKDKIIIINLSLKLKFKIWTCQ